MTQSPRSYIEANLHVSSDAKRTLWTPEQDAQLLAMRDAGLSYRTIAARLTGITRSSTACYSRVRKLQGDRLGTLPDPMATILLGEAIERYHPGYYGKAGL